MKSLRWQVGQVPRAYAMLYITTTIISSFFYQVQCWFHSQIEPAVKDTIMEVV